MKKEREELRRGIRSFIQDAGVELAEFTGAPAPKVDEAPSAPPPTRPGGSAPRPSGRLDQHVAPLKPAADAVVLDTTSLASSSSSPESWTTPRSKR